MCGINGIIYLNSKSDSRLQVGRMNDALAHRGPDDAGIFCEPGIALGHRRLSIIDLSAAGHQPMSFSNERYMIVYNGELYNFREIRNELNDVAFKTNSDTEVILAAYAQWGEKCLDHFNGMFAFAIYDKKTQDLFIARDRLGIKPVYYTQTNDHLVFSSELRGLFASGLVKKKLDENALQDYLRYQTVHAPATIIENVQLLLPGHFIKVSNGTTEIKCWWKLQVKPTSANPTKEEAQINVRKLLRDAVERRLIADVPFGAFLSGGIDSSIVVGLMSEVAAAPVNTFSITFDDSEFSEAVYAKQIAEKFKTIHHEIKLKPEDFLRDLPDALDAMDHPSGDGPNTFVVSKATKKAGVTMALSGLGGDELFCGYDIFKRTAELENKKWLNALPRGLRVLAGNRLKKNAGIAGEKKAAVLRLKKINFASFYPVSRQVLLEEQIAKIATNSNRTANEVYRISSEIADKFPDTDHLLSRVSLAEISTYMQNVLLRDTDQMSMAHALEVRVPFLDYTLVEYVLNLPDHLKFPHTPKKLLVDACKDLLPDEIVNRPKMGFTFPWKGWMKNELKSFCEVRLQSLGKRKQFNAEGLNSLWNSFLSDDPKVTWSRIWPLVVLSHWLEKNEIES
ncbi:MAG: asparagine synthase (glutamine-hydrolyzing) [Bacteroidia bacterium]